jgi:2-C-methyl-D-erythritol 4-phosphate cytidylyltransferase
MNNASAPLHCTALVVAAGSGVRMGYDKLLISLGEHTVLQRSVDRLLECSAIESMVIVCPPDRWHTLDFRATDKPVLRANGGRFRQDSVRSGLQACPPHTTHIAIHDAARPFVALEDLERVIQTAFETGAASLAHRVVDTLQRADDSQVILDSVSRDHLWGMETPQVFCRDWLWESILATESQASLFTDEVSLLHAAGHPVFLVESRHANLKITTPADLALASALCLAPPTSHFRSS